MKGKYLKLGKRKAEAAVVEVDPVCEGGNEEFVTKTLLKGYEAKQRSAGALAGVRSMVATYIGVWTTAAHQTL